MQTPDPSHDVSAGWRPAASWSVLRRRAALIAQIRQFFNARGFLEVETPCLSCDTVVDRHLDPLPAASPREDASRWWLQTSPEFGMKRLLAAGGERLFQIGKAFRCGERGRLHNPEFTMLEWYQVGQSYQQAMGMLSGLAAATLTLGPARRLTYREAFLQWLGLDPLTASAARWQQSAAEQGVEVPETLDATDNDAWRCLMLAERIEPQLGTDGPLILYDYPASQAALAQTRPTPHGEVAERFELYVQGIELANGYHELLSADELQRRNAAVNRLRVADGKPALPEDSRLLAAMRHGLPSCCGVALGLDRLVMCAVGAASIDEVIAFPVERA